MSFEFVIAIIIIAQLRKTLRTAVELPKWDRILKFVLIGSAVLIALQVSVSFLRDILDWVGKAILLGLVYINFTQPSFRPARPYINAWWPFIAVTLISDIIQAINPEFYNDWDEVFDIALIFTIIWLVAMIIITNKQRKALNMVKLKVEEEERQKQIIASMKDELEVQVAERTAELTRQKNELEHALEELKSTQTQLIHAEKMASLGELTAGIAHEIQNPLNFVNNFSEINSELIDELNHELEKGNLEEVKAIAADIKQNEQKIVHHGKRADAIVKGMLQHSRTSTGQKEPTNLNDLLDEYLRLCYHGIRAKDKTFNALMITDFDERVGEINIIPQDIGRVFLNLFTNAFYSVNEKKKTLVAGGAEGNQKPFEPTVSVSSERKSDTVVIRVKDNGTGIPQSVLDKIFQPFFTTKPTGQGTGLGLSLSYDIITKGHGGELFVYTKEGEFAEFIIEIPVE